MKNSWNSWGSSVIGPSHIKLGIPNQDAWLAKHFSWGDVIVAADGLGSHQNSDIGSIAICKAVISTAKLYSHLKHIDVQRLLKRIHSKWLSELGGVPPKKASSTALFVIRYKKKFIVGQLGDGIIMGFTKSSFSFVMKEKKEESFSNITHSLKEKFYFKDWKIKVLNNKDFEAFLLCTDGVSDDLLLNKELEFGSELYKSYRRHSQRRVEKGLTNMLINWPVPNHSDDKTIACLYRSSDEI